MVLADFQESKENINFRRVRSAEKMKALEQQLAVTMTHAPEFPEMTFGVPIEPSKTIEHSALLSDKRFHNLLIEMWWVQTDVQIEFDNLEEWTNTTIQMLEAELDL